MKKAEAKKKIEELRERLEYYAKKYYDEDNPDVYKRQHLEHMLKIWKNYMNGCYKKK